MMEKKCFAKRIGLALQCAKNRHWGLCTDSEAKKDECSLSRQVCGIVVVGTMITRDGVLRCAFESMLANDDGNFLPAGISLASKQDAISKHIREKPSSITSYPSNVALHCLFRSRVCR